MLLKNIKSVPLTKAQKFFTYALGIFLAYAGTSHLFWERSEFLAQVPTWVLINPDLVVLISGIIEITLGLSLIFLNQYRVYVGFLTALFFVLIFPGNISQYTNEISAFGLDTDNKRLIRLFFQPLLVWWALAATGAWRAISIAKQKKSKIYDFTAKSLSNQEIDFSKYKGKIILIVNTASKCGFTPQYKGLENLHQNFKNKGLIVLGFPCNQFGNQEPGDENSIKNDCLINYGVSFQMFSKVEVNGPNAHPLYIYLKSCMGGLFSSKIKWNFTKFLIDENGIVVKRFSSLDSPKKIEHFIEQMIS